MYIFNGTNSFQLCQDTNLITFLSLLTKKIKLKKNLFYTCSYNFHDYYKILFKIERNTISVGLKMHKFYVRFLGKIISKLLGKILDSQIYIIVVQFNCEKLCFH